MSLPKFTLEKKIIFFFFLAASALLSVLVIFYYNAQKVKSTNDLVEHTQEVLRKSDNVFLDVLNIETGSRGYSLTGNENYLEPFNNAVITINSNIEKLALLTKDNLNQQSRIDSLKKVVEERLIYTKNTIEVRKKNGLNEAEKIVTDGMGKILTDKIRSIIAAINSEEVHLLEQRKKENEKSNKNSGLIFLALLVFIVTILTLVAILIIRNQKTRNKYEENLKKSIELFTAVNKELEAFTYSVSHDLRAPLRAINGYSKILQEDYAMKLDADGISSLNAILNNSKKMGELIDDLLAFSRLGRKEITTSEINMNILVKSVKEEEIIGNSNEIEFKINELPSAMGQQALIKQVWVNLISNAIKFSKNQPKITIEIGSYFKDNVVVYYIKDNGAGFEMQYYDKLFGIFQRLHSQEEFEGTGIGLAIVQKIVTRHNGKVWAESKLNEGSCFYFSLPTINS